MFSVVLLEVSLARSAELACNHIKSTSLKLQNELVDEATLDSLWLTHDESALTNSLGLVFHSA